MVFEIDEVVRSYRAPAPYTSFTLFRDFGDDPELLDMLTKYIKKHQSAYKKLMKFVPIADPDLAWVRSEVNRYIAERDHGVYIKIYGRLIELMKAPKVEPGVASDRITDFDIAKAREYPITNLIEFNRGFASCIFHNEKTGSLHLLPNSNETRAHCHGACGKTYDGIDAYMFIHNCNFIDAVKALTR